MSAITRNGHKFNARRTKVDGYNFASHAESARYLELKMLAKAGEIRGLVLQPKYPLHTTDRLTGKAWKIGNYIADFCYIDKDGKSVTEDVKGFLTQIYVWKRKHVEAEYGITITEITRGR